jgi:disulfide bond formation protein DsbB
MPSLLTRNTNKDLPPALEPNTASGAWVVAALLLSLLASVGSLYLSLRMGLRPCPLCYYQRTLALSLVGVLGMGLLVTAARDRRLALLAGILSIVVVEDSIRRRPLS